MDDFKNYISEHKESLDLDEPSPFVWQKIEKELQPKKGLVLSMFVKWAVAACIILLAGFATYNLLKDDNKNQEVAKMEMPRIDTLRNAVSVPKEQANVFVEQPEFNKRPVQKEAKKPDVKLEDVIAKDKLRKEATIEDPYQRQMTKAFNDMDASYASMVNIQMERIKGTPIYAEDGNYFSVFKKQFQDLNNDEKVLKEETRKIGINDDIITRMIAIYQEKITLLKQLQSEINKMNNRVKNSNEDGQTQEPSYINL